MICRICDKEIPKARLKALPGTDICVKCAKDLEDGVFVNSKDMESEEDD